MRQRAERRKIRSIFVLNVIVKVVVLSGSAIGNRETRQDKGRGRLAWMGCQQEEEGVSEQTNLG